MAWCPLYIRHWKTTEIQTRMTRNTIAWEDSVYLLLYKLLLSSVACILNRKNSGWHLVIRHVFWVSLTEYPHSVKMDMVLHEPVHCSFNRYDIMEINERLRIYGLYLATKLIWSISFWINLFSYNIIHLHIMEKHAWMRTYLNL